MSDQAPKEYLLPLLRHWYQSVPECFDGFYLFGSTIRGAGVNFDPSGAVRRSDVDLLLVFSSWCDVAEKRAVACRELSEQRRHLETELLGALRRQDASSPIASVLPVTRFELHSDIHKSGDRTFFRDGSFLNILEDEGDIGTTVGTHYSLGTSSPLINVIQAAQAYRNKYLSISSNGECAADSFGDPPVFPKTIARLASIMAWAHGRIGDEEKAEPAAGVSHLFELIGSRVRRTGDKETIDLQTKIGRRAAGTRLPLTAFDQLLLLEILFDEAVSTIDRGRPKHMAAPYGAKVSGKPKVARQLMPDYGPEHAGKTVVPTYKFQEILEASPYEASFNINGQVTEEFFYKNLYVADAQYNHNLQSLYSTVTTGEKNARLIFLTGFSGCGKTTFIKRFLNMYSSTIQGLYIDFHTISPEEDISPFDKALLSQIRRFPDATDGESLLLLTRVLRFIADNRLAMADYVTKTILKICTGKAAYTNQDYLLRSLESLKFNDLFHVFFLMAFFRSDTSKKTVVCFDNLDVVNLDYVANDFKTRFSTVLDKVTRLAQEDCCAPFGIHFTRDFSFIFCLRDANSASINAHLQGRFGNNVEKKEFRLLKRGAFYTSIIDKRLRVVQELRKKGQIEGDTKRIPSLRIITRVFVKDRYFSQVFVRAFNSDYRKLMSTLVAMVEEAAGDITMRRFFSDFRKVGRSGPDDVKRRFLFGHRGSMMYWLIRRLLREDRLRKLLQAFPVGVRREEGHCQPTRMILTVLLNECAYSEPRGRDSFESSHEVSLHSLLSHLDGVYKPEDVARIVCSLFLCHKSDWVHHVTVLNKKITDERSLLDAAKWHVESKMKGLRSDRIENLVRMIDKVRIKPNPAGFVLVRYLLPHFEYYANIAPGCPDRPLFMIGLAQEEGRYEFDVKIGKVLETVRAHVRLMQDFFQNRFVRGKGMTEEEYRTSMYCFRHVADNDVTGADILTLGEGHKARGTFHSWRIVGSHVDYIDSYRMFLLNDSEYPDLVSGKTLRLRDHPNAAVINRILVDRVAEYLELLADSTDGRIGGWWKKCMEKIKAIEASQYRDCSISIHPESQLVRARGR